MVDDRNNVLEGVINRVVENENKPTIEQIKIKSWYITITAKMIEDNDPPINMTLFLL